MVHQFQQESRIEEKKFTFLSCTQGHDWQPAIIIGYYQCARCNALAACTVCVSNVRGSAIAGTCLAHLDLTPSQARREQEVLG